MRVNVPTSELKVGDVIEHPAGHGVVTSISKNADGIDEIAQAPQQPTLYQDYRNENLMCSEFRSLGAGIYWARP